MEFNINIRRGCNNIYKPRVRHDKSIFPTHGGISLTPTMEMYRLHAKTSCCCFPRYAHGSTGCSAAIPCTTSPIVLCVLYIVDIMVNSDKRSPDARKSSDGDRNKTRVKCARNHVDAEFAPSNQPDTNAEQRGLPTEMYRLMLRPSLSLIRVDRICRLLCNICFDKTA